MKKFALKAFLLCIFIINSYSTSYSYEFKKPQVRMLLYTLTGKSTVGIFDWFVDLYEIISSRNQLSYNPDYVNHLASVINKFDNEIRDRLIEFIKNNINNPTKVKHEIEKTRKLQREKNK
jgi:hypothetical protein